MEHLEKHLLLLSYEYPFGWGETFLENEIPVLAGEFASITILPSRAYFSPGWFVPISSQHRYLPENCSLLLPTNQKLSRFHKPDLAYFFFKADYHRIPLKGVGYAVKELMREVLKAASLMPPLQSFLATHNKKEVVAYSYWKGSSTAALCYAKEQGLLATCVTRCHGGDIYYDILPFPYRPLEKYIIANCDLVLPVSKTGVDYLHNIGFSKDKLQVARLGIEKFKELSSCSNDGILRIVSCSNIIPIKRVGLLVQALALLSHPFHWVHFGDGEERTYIERLIGQLPSQSTAELRGRVPNHEVLHYYRENPVDVFVNVSSSEGVPVSIMEAMIAGIPCIATDVGGSSELVDSSCGLLLDIKVGEHELASALSSVIENLSSWKKKRKMAYTRACQQCDRDKNYQEFSMTLKRLL